MEKKKKKARINRDQRANIQAAIAMGKTLAETAAIIRRPRSTVYREVLGNAEARDGSHSCSSCSKGCPPEHRRRFFWGKCPDYEQRDCERWSRWPHVCNGCPKSGRCHRPKRYYDCVSADASSTAKRSAGRSHGALSPEKVAELDERVSPRIKKGQSIHHIYATDPALGAICCERTVRRYVYKGALTAKCHELVRYVRFKRQYGPVKGRKSAEDRKRFRAERVLGRTFSDYLDWVADNPLASRWQLDSVVGGPGCGKAILTVTNPETRFQFGTLIRLGRAADVDAALARLRGALGAERFADAFACCLADNGSEFATLYAAEEMGIRVFYTNPYKSTDKAACERNHEILRYVIPKGGDLDSLTQADVDLVFSHINSYVRESNKDKTPYDLLAEKFGEDFPGLLGVSRVEASDVTLKPELLKKP